MNRKYFEEYVNINGVNHYFIHFKRNPDKPVVLFLHGGPGQSECIFAPYIEDNKLSDYTIVYYDQRGAGRTYLKTPNAEADNDKLLSDLNEIVKYICDYYHKEQIVILGHSWGTVLGSEYILEHPDKVKAYIGTGQVVDFIKNEEVGYSKLLEKVNKPKDLKKIKELGNYPNMDSMDQLLHQMKYIREYQGKYGLAMKINLNMLKIAIKSPVFHFKDFGVMMKSFDRNMKVFTEFTKSDLRYFTNEYKVPIYYVLGEKDNQAVKDLAIDYYNEIVAPKKELHIISGAGHMAYLDNKKEYISTLNNIINSL